MNLAVPEISFVIPVYNEEAVLEMFRRRMSEVMSSVDCSCEVVMVNDGSRDDSLAIMDGFALGDARYRIINMSRNYGHQIAITAGIDHARGNAVIIMDADLQDPPEIALEIGGGQRVHMSNLYRASVSAARSRP